MKLSAATTIAAILLGGCSLNSDATIYTNSADELREFARNCRAITSPTLTASVTITTQDHGWLAKCNVKEK